MLWLFQLALGMYLAYYCLSPRLRGFTNGLIPRLFRITKPSKEIPRVRVKSRYVLEDKGDAEELGEPIELEPIILGNKQGILVSEDKINEWLSSNPDLVKANKVKEMVK